MSNNFDTPILLDSGTGTPGAPGDYFGFGRAAGTAVSTGPRIYAGAGNPNGTLTAPEGSLWLDSTGAGAIYVNTTGAAAWAAVPQNQAFASVANSATVTNTTAETAFDVTYTIAANTLGAGSTVRVKAVVRFPSTNAADTATLRGRIGGVDFITSSAVDVANNDAAILEFFAVTRAAAGAAVDTEGGGICIFDTGAAGTLSTATLLPDGTTLATNGALVVDVTCQWSAAATTDQAILVALVVDIEA